MRVYTDASHGDYVIGVGYVVCLKDGTEIQSKRYKYGEYSSMDAEWYALMEGMEVALSHRSEDDTSIDVITDCEPLVTKIRQPDDLYNDKWFSYRKRALNKLFEFDTWRLRWQKRGTSTENEAADRLAREALWQARDEYGSLKNTGEYTGSAKQGLTFI
jgi:ribonuclease HI